MKNIVKTIEITLVVEEGSTITVKPPAWKGQGQTNADEDRARDRVRIAGMNPDGTRAHVETNSNDSEVCASLPKTAPSAPEKPPLHPHWILDPERRKAIRLDGYQVVRNGVWYCLPPNWQRIDYTHCASPNSIEEACQNVDREHPVVSDGRLFPVLCSVDLGNGQPYPYMLLDGIERLEWGRFRLCGRLIHIDPVTRALQWMVQNQYSGFLLGIESPPPDWENHTLPKGTLSLLIEPKRGNVLRDRSPGPSEDAITPPSTSLPSFMRIR